MDEILLRKITRQLKILNFWITFFGTLIIIGFIIASFALYKVATYADKTVQKFDSFQQKTQQELNVKSKVCSDDSVSSLLQSKTNLCN